MFINSNREKHALVHTIFIKTGLLLLNFIRKLMAKFFRRTLFLTKSARTLTHFIMRTHFTFF